LSQRSFHDLYPVTAVLLLLNGGFFALEFIGARNADAGGGAMIGLGGVPRQVAVDLGSSVAGLIRHEHQYWRLLASAFLHGGLLHILFNGSVLLDLGRVCETKLSSAKFLTIYVLSGLGGAVAPYFWRVHQDQLHRSSVGASGAICGLIGLLLVYSVKERKPDLRNSLSRWVVFIVLISVLIPGIDHLGHLGGFVVGALLGLTVKDYTTSREARLWRIPAWICAALLVYSLGMAVWHNGQRNWDWQPAW